MSLILIFLLCVFFLIYNFKLVPFQLRTSFGWEKKHFGGVEMGNFLVLGVVLFLFVAVFDVSVVDANFPKSMYIFWGGHHSSFRGNGDELQLVLDQSSGTINRFSYSVSD